MSKTRILSLLLAIVMVLGMLPVNSLPVSAAEEALQILAEKTTICIYEQQQLTANADLSNGQGSWSTSDAAVVSVDNQGKIQGLKAGTANITLTVGTQTASVAITVQPLTNYRLKKTSGTVTFMDGIERLSGTASIAELYTDSTYATKIQLEEGVFSADVTMPADNGFRLMFGRSGSANYYSFRVLKTGATTLYKTVSSKDTELAKKTISAFTAGQVYNVKVVMQKVDTGLQIDCFVDGKCCVSYTDESPLTGKNVGVRLNTSATTVYGYFTNFYVRNFSETLSAADMEAVINKVYDYTCANEFTYNNNWIEATYYLGVIEAFRATGNMEYYDDAYDYAEAFNWKVNQNYLTGYMDDLAVGLVYAELHDLASDSYDYKLDSAKLQFDYNVSRGSYNYSWVDEIYMGGFTAEYLSRVTGDGRYSNMNVEYYKKWHDKLFDTTDGLWYRDSRYVFGNGNDLSTSPNGLKVYWARGNAWVYVSLAQQLRDMPTDHPAYAGYVSDFVAMSAALKDRQRADGFWTANLGDPDHIPGRESTGTGGFLYGLAVGLELGILDHETYYPVAKKAYEGMAAYAVKPSGFLGYCQPVGDSPASATTENTNLFGIGLFLMGASKLMTLCEDHDSQVPTVPNEAHDPSKAICDIEDGYYTGGVESIIATNIASTESGNGVENLMNFNWGGEVSGARWSAKKETKAEYAEVLIALNDTLDLEKLSLVAFQHRTYAFSIEASIDRENWVTVADNMSGQIVSGDNYMTTVTLEQAVTTRYLRLRVKNCLNDSTTWISIKGLVLYGDVVNKDPVPTKKDLTNTYKWSSTTSEVAGSPQAAFDGSQETRWCAASAKEFPATLSVDLGSVQDITKINTYFEQSSEWVYTLSVSADNENWTVFGSNPAEIPKQKDYTNENTLQGRYVKLEITAAGKDASGDLCWASVYELEVFGADASKNLALKQPCAATSIAKTGASVEAAFDGNVNTRWCATGSAMPQTVMVDLGKPHTLNGIYVMFEQYSNFVYTVEVSQDGEAWENFAVSSGDSVFEVTHRGTADARYVRLVITGSSGGAWASVREIELFAEEKNKAVATVNDTNYLTVQAAVDAANGGTVKLLADSSEEITATGDLYLDLNGYSLSKVTVSGTLYGMDTATNEYKASGAKIATVVGQYAPNYRHDDAKRYMAIVEDDGVSFHRFYMGITKVSLEPSVVGFGYKAEFYGDDAVQSKISSIGYTLWLDGGKEVTRTTGFKNLLTLRLNHYDVAGYGETAVNARVFIILTDGSTIESLPTAYSMRQMLELIAEHFDSYNKTKKQAVKEMCLVQTATHSWNIAPILNWTEGVALTTNYFTETEGGKYSLSTNAYTDTLVDNVIVEGQTIRTASYRVKGTIALNDANTWGQARILVTADETNGYVIALEKVGENAYQIFTMSRLNEGAWNDWRLISHFETNGNRNSIDFELVVNGGKIALLIDDKLCYENSRASMTESTPGFGTSNVATTTVSGLQAQIFADSAEAEGYLATKEKAEYVSRFQGRMDALYHEYMTQNGCAGKGGTLIFGDSYMDFWSTWESQTGLTKYTDGYNVGIGGSAVRDWLHAYDQLIKPFAPERILINIGYNDIRVWGDDGEQFAENLKTLLETIHADFPNTEIYYLYINPSPSIYANGAYTDLKIADAITRSKELVSTLNYVTGIDIFDLMTTADGKNSVAAYYVSDKVHLSAEGYSVLSKCLNELIFKNAPTGFFGNAGDYQSSNGVDFSNDQGENPSIRFFGASPQYTFINDLITDKFVFETQVNVSQVLNNDAWPKFGLLVNGASEMVKFYVDMKTDMTATQVGVVYQPTGSGDDWAGAKAVDVPGMSFTGSDTIKLKLIRDGRGYYFYVNDVLVLRDNAGFQAETGAVGMFSFNTELTASNYSVLTGEDANDAIHAAKSQFNFFTTAELDLSNDVGAHVGTVNVNSGKTEFLWVKDFAAKDFYFETKVHVNEIYNNDGYPKFGILVQDDNTRETFYVDMTPNKTATKVGVMTATMGEQTWIDNWGGAKTETVEGMNFSGKGEYVTLGLKKVDGSLYLYVNGKFALYLDSAITGDAAVAVFGFNTGMELKEYFINKQEGADALLTLHTEGQIGTMELGGAIWTDKTYIFNEMPEAFAGVSYIQNAMKSDISFTAKKDGYIYVITPYRGHGNSIADNLEIDLYDRMETPAFYLANYKSQVNYWIYERTVQAGETVTIPGGSDWHMVVVSELPIDPTLHQMSNFVFADHQLAILEPTAGTVETVDNGTYPISDRDKGASAAVYLKNLPYYLLNKSLIKVKLKDDVQATVTKAGKVFLIASTSATRKAHYEAEGYTLVEDLKEKYGNTMSQSSYDSNGYGLYVKDVAEGAFEKAYYSWSITIFAGNEKLPAEPPVSIEMTQMPTKTTYKLGESFDAAGMVIMGTDKYGNVTPLDPSQYVTVPSAFTANAYAASVIVEDMIIAVPVTVTDADGNPLADDTAVDTTKYTTQKAPLLNGSVKRSTTDEVIAAIAKMEADGATAFNVHLTSLNVEYRNYESFKRIADCTDYPVMAIAYGDESNREYRIELMKEAVRAGFNIVDIPMNTFDADSKASLAGTVFETANPAEVSMNATVIEQQKALIQEFKDLGAEVLVSAHIGVSLTEAEGVALGKEMEARGADVAKIVLGNSANSMQDVVMQTNQTLQNELNIKFYYNASGNASKPYRTASALIGTHMVFCYAEYHESNLTTYDYITDLKAFYNTIPTLKVEEPMIKTNNGQKLDTVALGKTIWTTRDYVFTSMPEAFLGKPFVKASYGVKGETVDITVQKPGYIYVLTNAYKTDNSQAEILDEMNYTKLDLAGWKFCDFSGNSSYIWVYEKYVEPGETLQLGQWSVVIASEEKLNLDADCFKTADSDMAILQPAEGASVGNMEAGTLAFADRTYTISGMPYWLAGKNYIVGNYGAGSATVTRGGVVYMITNTGSTKVNGVSMTRASILEADGFVKVEVPAFTAISHSSFASNDFLLFKKTVSENDTVTWPSWAIPVFSGDLVLSENLAKIAPDGTTTKACKYEQNVRLFDNRTYYASGDQLTALHGKSYLYAGFDEGATGTVTEAGTVYVQIPVKNTNATYVALEESLIADGFTPVAYRLYRNNKGIPGKSLGYAQKLYQKEVAVGDVIHYGQYNLVYFDTLAAEEYYEMPSVTTAANIYNNPEVTGIQNALYTYTPASRNWQGCPVVTITDGPNGNRMWAGWFTGGETELATGNMAVLLYSDDNGATWVDPAVAIVHPNTAAQVTKPQLWTMEDGRLWVSWSQHTGTGGFDGKMGTWAAICENPGAPMDQLKWSEPQRLFDGRGNGKITVLNQGQPNEEWLTTAFDWIDRNYSDVYSSTDKGATWTWKGRAEVTGSTYNNAIIVERDDGSLWMLLRQLEGNMKQSFSYDGGKTWTNAQVSNIAHPNSAIYVGKTSSGKLLMINHKDFSGRNNLTAFLSEDGGKTWPYTILLDARLGVSYPDVIEDNGTFYVVYDYDRFNTGRMYMARITEADIMAGKLVSEGSYLKHQFASMGITGPQVSENAQKIDVTAMEMSASTNGSPAIHAFDGDTDTRWCATSDAMPQWLMIDLKDVYDLEAVYLFFEQKSDWNFKIEVSVDGDVWNVYTDPDAQALVDVTINQQAQARYIRVTVESTTGGAWASIWEMEVYGNKL